MLLCAAAFASAVTLTPVARGAWSAPVTISRPGEPLGSLQLASGPTGDLLAWQVSEYSAARKALVTHASYALARAGGPFEAERHFPARYGSGPLVNLGGGRLAQLILVPTGVNTSRPEVALGGVSASFGAPLAIPGASVFVGRASLTGNARGELLLAWIAADARGGHRVVWASTRAPGGGFGRPQLISRSAQAEQVASAVGTQGDMVVAFPNKFERLLARVRRRGRRWGSLQSVGPAAGGTENDVTPFVAGDGHVVLAWYETQLCEGGCEYPGFVRVAVQPARGWHFGAPQLLERDPYALTGAPIGASLAPVVLAAGTHAPLLAFLARGPTPPLGSSLTPTVVKVSYESGARFSAPRVISPEDQQAGDVAAAAAQNGVLVTWVREEAPGYFTGTVFASLIPAVAGSLGAPEQASPSEHVLTALPAFERASRWPENSIAPWIIASTSRPTSEAQTVVNVSAPLCPAEAAGSPAPGAIAADPVCAG